MSSSNKYFPLINDDIHAHSRGQWVQYLLAVWFHSAMYVNDQTFLLTISWIKTFLLHLHVTLLAHYHTIPMSASLFVNYITCTQHCHGSNSLTCIGWTSHYCKLLNCQYNLCYSNRNYLQSQICKSSNILYWCI